MNRDVLSGPWNQRRGKARRQWGKPTHQEWDEVRGDWKEVLVGKIQERYGLRREEAEEQVDRWLNRERARHLA